MQPTGVALLLRRRCIDRSAADEAETFSLVRYTCGSRRLTFVPFLQGIAAADQSEGSLGKWMRTEVNKDYQLSSSYPQVLYVPRAVNAEILHASAAFRSGGRIPALTWLSNTREGKPSIVRCAQPWVGVTSRRSKMDEELVVTVRQCSASGRLAMIFDARSSLAAGGNKLLGKGSENPANYEGCKVCGRRGMSESKRKRWSHKMLYCDLIPSKGLLHGNRQHPYHTGEPRPAD